MLTTEAFNALLKTLEEPPEHVFFMFATTELHKIPITILSRCQRYELQKVASRELATFFRKIADAEKIEISDWAINVIVREAGGSVRDGLSLLDQMFSFGGEQIADEDVTQVLGLVDSQLLSSLAAAVLDGDVSGSLKILDNASSYGIDLKRLINDLLYYFRALIICRISSEPEKLVDVADQDLEEMQKISKQHSSETLQLYFDLLLKGAEEMRYSSHPRLMLEMALIKTAEADRVIPVTKILERLEEFQGAQQLKPEPSLTPQETRKPHARKETPKPVSAPSDKETPAREVKKTEKEMEPVPTGEKVEPAVKKKTARTVPSAPQKKEIPKKPELSPPTQPKTKDVRKHWDEFIEYVLDRKKWMAHTLRLCSGVREEDHNLVLKFDDPSECKMLKTAENIKFLTEFSQDFFQKEFKIVMRIRGGDSEDINGQESNGPQEERRALANDPLVQMATEVLGGRVVNIRTGPRSR
jgi:DNA polymerase-3 subunit gamma/tau